MADSDSDSFFDDDDSIEDGLPGAPSEDLLRDSADSFEDLDDMGGLESDTPDAAVPQEELIAAAQKEDASAEEIDAEEADGGEATSSEEVVDGEEAADGDSVEAAGFESTAKKKSRFNLTAIDTSEMTVFDSILLISLFFVMLATILMFFELRQFGNFPFGGFPWRTPGF